MAACCYHAGPCLEKAGVLPLVDVVVHSRCQARQEVGGRRPQGLRGGIDMNVRLDGRERILSHGELMAKEVRWSRCDSSSPNPSQRAFSWLLRHLQYAIAR